jgi:methionyl-tRNA formyltransferase
MRLVLLTQDDPFFLAENINYLISQLPEHSEIVACVLFEVGAFGKRKSLIEQAKETQSIFGTQFFLRYGIKYVLNKFNKNKKITHVLSKYNIPLVRLEKTINHNSSIEKIKSFNPDLLISIAGNQIFKLPIIDLAPKGCINLHTALLPKYRGLLPTFWVMKNKESETGVSIFFVDEGIDSGPILVQKKVTIGDLSQEQLIQHTKKIGMDAIIEAIEKIKSGNYSLMDNPDDEQSYFSTPTREDVEVFLKGGNRFY